MCNYVQCLLRPMSRKDPNKPRGRTTAYAYFVIAEKEAFYRVRQFVTKTFKFIFVE